MTETLLGVSPPSLMDPADPPSAEELAAARELVRQARAQGVALTGPGGLLKALTKTVLETALEEELAEHLGYDKHDPLGRNRGNSRNGKRTKTVLTDSGEVAVEVPRDRDGSFAPVIVAKRQRRLSSIAEIYDAQVSKDTISRITDRVVEEMQAWTSRPLERVYAAVVVDAINVKVRDGQVANRPVYAAIGVDLEGQKDILVFGAILGGAAAIGVALGWTEPYWVPEPILILALYVLIGKRERIRGKAIGTAVGAAAAIPIAIIAPPTWAIALIAAAAFVLAVMQTKTYWLMYGLYTFSLVLVLAPPGQVASEAEQRGVQILTGIGLLVVGLVIIDAAAGGWPSITPNPNSPLRPPKRRLRSDSRLGTTRANPGLCALLT
jgi:hypothetical protein